MDVSCPGTAVPEIPKDIWFEVLLKVPSKDLSIWRRVSKFHRDLIDSPEFCSKYDQLSTKKTSHVILTGSVDQLVNLERSKFNATFSNTFKDEYDYTDGNLVGSCMGILCYQVPSLSSLIFWNPSTGCSRRVPLKPCKDSSRYKFFLGHDAVADDLKVVKMKVFDDVRRNYFDCEMTEIYSSKVDSWTRLKRDDSLRFSYCSQVFVEGTNSIHWLESEDHILAYNVSTQKFNKLKYELPESYESRFSAELSSLRGCLCVSSCSWQGRDYNLNLMMMQEYGVEKSWIKLFSFPYHSTDYSCSLLPLILNNDERELVVLSARHGLFRHRSNRWEMVEILRTVYSSQRQRYISLAGEGYKAVVFTPMLRKP